MTAPTLIAVFAHHWKAEILPARPLVLPARHFTYPAQAEEVERGALEVLIQPESPPGRPAEPERQPFLATCALGFHDPAAPTGLWATPNPQEICAVSGGYAYLIDTTAPEHFTMIPYRPVLEILPLPEHGLLLFVGHRAIVAWGAEGRAWESEQLSSEGIALAAVEGSTLCGLGWNMATDKEAPFAIDVKTGRKDKEPRD